METAWRELRHAARGLLRSRVFALVSIATLALGIGATTTVFSLVNALLLRPLPIAQPERVVTLEETRRGSRSVAMGFTSYTPARYERYRESTGRIFTAGPLEPCRDAGSLPIRQGRAAPSAAVWRWYRPRRCSQPGG